MITEFGFDAFQTRALHVQSGAVHRKIRNRPQQGYTSLPSPRSERGKAASSQNCFWSLWTYGFDNLFQHHLRVMQETIDTKPDVVKCLSMIDQGLVQLSLWATMQQPTL